MVYKDECKIFSKKVQPVERSTKILSSNVCLLPYCKTRLCENVQTTERTALRDFQTDNHTVSFLCFTLKGLLQWFLEKNMS